MDTIDLLNLRQWFSNYCTKFYSPDKEEQKNIALKEIHSRNVASNMLSIAGAELRNRNKVFIAEAIGLLHDVGRFPQYEQYKTFRDSVSVNHGKLGAEVIIAENILGRIPLHEQEVIIEAVKLSSALTFENSGCALAHALHNGLTKTGQVKGEHGEIVAYTTLVEMAYEKRPKEQIAAVVSGATSHPSSPGTLSMSTSKSSKETRSALSSSKASS